jgi:hypothetical protein
MPYPHISFWMQSQCKTVSQPPESRLNLKYKNVRSFHHSRSYMILQTIQHNTHAHPCFKHYSSSGQMALWANVFLGKCLSGQMSFWANVFLGKCLSGQMSFCPYVFLGKCLSGQTSSGQMSFLANVFLGKCHLGKCPSGQMSFWANVFWANVFWANVFWANVLLGKCLWANVSGQMSYGQMSYHHYFIQAFLNHHNYHVFSSDKQGRDGSIFRQARNFPRRTGTELDKI